MQVDDSMQAVLWQYWVVVAALMDTQSIMLRNWKIKKGSDREQARLRALLDRREANMDEARSQMWTLGCQLCGLVWLVWLVWSVWPMWEG